MFIQKGIILEIFQAESIITMYYLNISQKYPGNIQMSKLKKKVRLTNALSVFLPQVNHEMIVIRCWIKKASP